MVRDTRATHDNVIDAGGMAGTSKGTGCRQGALRAMPKWPKDLAILHGKHNSFGVTRQHTIEFQSCVQVGSRSKTKATDLSTRCR